MIDLMEMVRVLNNTFDLEINVMQYNSTTGDTKRMENYM